MQYLPKELFELQIHFAYKMAEIYGLSFEESLFKFTSVYARLFGLPAREDDDAWGRFMETLPEDRKGQIDCIYAAYIAAEDEKERLNTGKGGNVTFGCFSYVYKEAENVFVLHFSGADPKGNLGKDRMPERMRELVLLAQSMKDQNKKGAQVRATSWILSIEAFTRLFPSEFTTTCTRVHKNLSQDNGLWGQFIDKDRNLKQNLAKELIGNTNEKKLSVDEYFPLQEMKAESTQEVFFDFYL